jgi:hypothetical protein
MCKELPVILFNTVVDPKRIIGGGEEQVVADPPPPKKREFCFHLARSVEVLPNPKDRSRFRLGHRDVDMVGGVWRSGQHFRTRDVRWGLFKPAKKIKLRLDLRNKLS